MTIPEKMIKLLGDDEKNLNRWAIMPYLWIGKLSIVKINSPPMVFRLNDTELQIPMGCVK